MIVDVCSVDYRPGPWKSQELGIYGDLCGVGIAVFRRLAVRCSPLRDGKNGAQMVIVGRPGRGERGQQKWMKMWEGATLAVHGWTTAFWPA